MKSLNEYLNEKKMEMELPNCNLYLTGFGRDTNGNSVIKLTFPNDSGFSIQTLDLPNSHKLKSQKDFTEQELQDISTEVCDYIQNYGSSKQKSKLKLYK